jgi:hypothetical protein
VYLPVTLKVSQLHYGKGENAMKNSMHTIVKLALRLVCFAPSLSRLGVVVSISVLALAFSTQQMSATVTYIVGTCKSGTQFSTIQSALDASPAPNTVEVCPALYAEQITITKPVTLEGIAAGNGAQAQIVGDGFGVNTTLFGGIPAAAHILVKDVSGGSVNLKNLYVNDQGNSLSDVFLVGVAYQNSSGTINQVVTAYQDGPGPNLVGWGMWIEGGNSKPSVTIESCSMHNFTAGALYALGTTTAADLTVAIKNNVVSSLSEGNHDIVVDEGSDPTVSGNVVNGGDGGDYGITILGSEGSISGNTVSGTQIGIELAADGALVKANNLYDDVIDGIRIDASSLKVSEVENNKITSVTDPGSGGGTGIELNCNNISSNQVHSNTVMDANYGYGDAPAGFAGSNTYLGVLFKVGTCADESVAQKAVRSGLQVTSNK